MRIEVICVSDEAKKAQGDALEIFVSKWLRVQGYAVERNVRMTGCELDLLCKNDVSGKRLYVECKAYNDTNVNSGQLKAFLGTIVSEGFDEGWFVTTGALGQDAKGFVEKWESTANHGKMHIYTPERVLERFVAAGLVCYPPESLLKKYLRPDESISEWVLVIHNEDAYWATVILRNGLPVCYVACGSKERNCDIIKNRSLVEYFQTTNFTLANKKLPYLTEYRAITRGETEDTESTPVVEVEIGENWSDYRPARPEHFVGRKRQVREVFSFVSAVKKKITDSRIFAIKGDSGIGKSSFIAKIRDAARVGKRNKGVFVFAVDMRAASDSSYILQSLLKCLREAQKLGFGDRDELSLSNQRDLLSSSSVARFLSSCSKRKQVLVLVFDQFEELYSKVELYDVFAEFQRLCNSVIAARSNFVLGLAWKTDCSIPLDHPAYHVWQMMSDHCYELILKPFSKDDVLESLVLFEKEIGESLRTDLKRYFVDNCQGLPWLLKKLCLHLQVGMNSGVSQIDMENGGLDIASLFDQDLSSLSAEEDQGLKLIAANAPMDWFDASQSVTQEVMTSLQNRRLVLRKGRKLNLYWDIFREYVLHKTLPEIPFNYIPQATSLDTFVRAANVLASHNSATVEELASFVGLRLKTIMNILADMIRFGLVKNESGRYYPVSGLDCLNGHAVLRFIRTKIRRHRIVHLLRQRYASKACTLKQFESLILECLPSGTYDSKTLNAYAHKMRSWLIRLGFLRVSDREIMFEDQGDVLLENPAFHSKEERRLFIGDTSPGLACRILEDVLRGGKFARKSTLLRKPGGRNAVSLLTKLELISVKGADQYVSVITACSAETVLEALFSRCEQERSIQLVVNLLNQNPNVDPVEVGNVVAKESRRSWKCASAKRVGGALRIWARWVIDSRKAGYILPPPLGHRKKTRKVDTLQMEFLDLLSPTVAERCKEF